MAGETLSIQQDNARLTVIGKSKADLYIDSGLGLDLGDLGTLDPLDLNWNLDVDDPDNLPDEIRIITPPTKTTYANGEKICLDGIVVGAYRNDSIWTNTKYPNGHIPINELMRSVFVAKGSTDCEVRIYDCNIGTFTPVRYYLSVNKGGKNLSFSGHLIIYNYLSHEPETDVIVQFSSNDIPSGVSVTVYLQGDSANFAKPIIMIASSNYNALFGWGYTISVNNLLNPSKSKTYTCDISVIHDSSIENRYPGQYTKSDKTVHYYMRIIRELTTAGTERTVELSSGSLIVSQQYLNGYEPAVAAWNMLYGDLFNGGTVALSWSRPVDGEILETFYEIEVENEESGGGGR